MNAKKDKKNKNFLFYIEVGSSTKRLHEGCSRTELWH